MPPIDALRAVLDIALPPRCPGCGVATYQDHRFCAECWAKLDFLTGEGCALCNLPLEGPAGTMCGRCLETPPRHGKVHAAVAYDDTARAIILRMKYAGRPGLARTIARVLAQRTSPPPDAIIIPVPLHRWRMWRRGFNQSAEIARHLGKAWALPVMLDVLVRGRATPSLRGLSPAQRRRAVRGSFRTRRRIDGAHVCLIDDVYTTGATADACAAALRRAGAAEVTVVVWARVTGDD